jgi:TetR/AcrR family transcriptional regulator
LRLGKPPRAQNRTVVKGIPRPLGANNIRGQTLVDWRETVRALEAVITRLSPATPARNGSSRKLKRREQQRAVETRNQILDAALTEFAQRGFEAASIRRIAERTRLQHPLITYHFRTKLILWRAVAEHAFAEIRTAWDRQAPPGSHEPPIDRVRTEYRTFMRFTLQYPDFHHFMLRESHPNNPRLAWLAKTILRPLLEDRLLPQIRAAQEAGEFPAGNPLLIHYLLIGATSVLCSLRDEIETIADISSTDPKVEHEYWQLIEDTVFAHRKPSKRKK